MEYISIYKKRKEETGNSVFLEEWRIRVRRETVFTVDPFVLFVFFTFIMYTFYLLKIPIT